LTERELLTNLQAIVADADRTPPNQVAQGAVGVLSTENRKVWASMREAMSRDPCNSVSKVQPTVLWEWSDPDVTTQSCLEIIDTALFVVCLDDSSPQTPEEMCAMMLCGTYKLEKGAFLDFLIFFLPRN
jgi:carnitine O-acetyltransferase